MLDGDCIGFLPACSTLTVITQRKFAVLAVSLPVVMNSCTAKLIHTSSHSSRRLPKRSKTAPAPAGTGLASTAFFPDVYSRQQGVRLTAGLQWRPWTLHCVLSSRRAARARGCSRLAGGELATAARNTCPDRRWHLAYYRLANHEKDMSIHRRMHIDGMDIFACINT